MVCPPCTERRHRSPRRCCLDSHVGGHTRDCRGHVQNHWNTRKTEAGGVGLLSRKETPSCHCLRRFDESTSFLRHMLKRCVSGDPLDISRVKMEASDWLIHQAGSRWLFGFRCWSPQCSPRRHSDVSVVGYKRQRRRYKSQLKKCVHRLWDLPSPVMVSNKMLYSRLPIRAVCGNCGHKQAFNRFMGFNAYYFPG